MIPLYVGTPPSIDSARQATARNMKTGSNFDSKCISNKSRKRCRATSISALLIRHPAATSTTYSRDQDRSQLVNEFSRTDDFHQVKGDVAKDDSDHSEHSNPKHEISSTDYIDEILHRQHVVSSNEQVNDMQINLRPQLHNAEWQALLPPCGDGQLEGANWYIGRFDDSIPTAALYQNTVENSVGVPDSWSAPLLHASATPKDVVSQTMQRLHNPDAETSLYVKGSFDDKPLLQRWVYETSNANITFAERLEKINWEATRMQRL